LRGVIAASRAKLCVPYRRVGQPILHVETMAASERLRSETQCPPSRSVADHGVTVVAFYGERQESSMRQLRVRHARMPGIGEKFEFVSALGLVITVVSQRTGRCDLSIADAVGTEPIATASLTKAEATALAALLMGAHVELIPDKTD
jgi:hypothetical protein